MVDISQWTEDITIQQPTSRNSYGEYSYSSTTIKGRLVVRQKEIVIRQGETVISVGKLYTTSSLLLDSKISEHRLVTKKECKDKYNVIAFYTYDLY